MNETESISLVNGEVNDNSISTLINNVIDKKNALDEDKLKDYAKNPNNSDYSDLNTNINTLCDAIDKLGYIIDRGQNYQVQYPGGGNRVLPEELGGGT